MEAASHFFHPDSEDPDEIDELWQEIAPEDWNLPMLSGGFSMQRSNQIFFVTRIELDEDDKPIIYGFAQNETPSCEEVIEDCALNQIWLIIHSIPETDDVKDARVGGTLKELKKLWEDFSDIPINDNDDIEKPFIFFEAGTHRFDIWHWFDERCPNGIWKDLLDLPSTT